MFNQAAYSDAENPANTRLFDTGWSGVLTFEEIMQAVTPPALSYLRRYQIGRQGQDYEDMLQRGFTVLWQRLQQDAHLLANANVYGAMMIVVANRGGRYPQRQYRELLLGNELTALDWEDYFLGSWEQERSETWAAWATRADLRMDITRSLTQLAESYLQKPAPQDQWYLAVLYYLTTSVERQHLPLLSGRGITSLRPIIQEVRAQLREQFAAHYQPNCGWYEKYRQNPAPARQALAQQANSVLLPTLQWLLAGAPHAQRAQFEQNHITRARLILERAYHTNH